MQSSHKDIYKQVSQKTGKSEQMYNDIGSFIFKETAKLMKRPPSLIIKLKGVGAWHIRKKRMEVIVSEFDEPVHDEYTSQATIDEWKEKRERYLNFKDRLKDYEEYLGEKAEIRKKRNETQTLYQPPEGED